LYTKAPHIGNVPERIARFSPDARLIYIMRDPIERTISHYWHHVQNNNEWRDILTAVQTAPIYQDVSNYAMQLEPYVRLFGSSQIITLTFEQLVAEPGRTMAQLFRWLGVDDRFVPPNLGQRENSTPQYVEQVRMRGWLKRLQYSAFWHHIRPRVPARIRQIARRRTVRRFDRASASLAKVHEFLRPIQQGQTIQLSQLLNRDFSEWTTLYGAPSKEAASEVDCLPTTVHSP
jgi:hypothetical protein